MAHRARGRLDRVVMGSPGAARDVRRIQPPKTSDLMRVFERRQASAILGPHSLARTAHHEAGHIVMYEWAGFEPVGAQIDERGGSAEFDPAGITASDDDDQDGTITASAAAIMHAGLSAELLFEAIDPGCVLVTRDSDDWHKASVILADRFGYPATGAHYYAQRLAMHVLSTNWPRVQEIANHLMEHGTWTP